MGPHASAAGEPADAGNKYYLVCTGSLLEAGREVPPLTLINGRRESLRMTVALPARIRTEIIIA